MARRLPVKVDTVVVGTGPSALILSYILHGHIPIYNPTNPHPDPILHSKLKDTTDLLHLQIDEVTSHFLASRFSYSTQALPINVLFDTLSRPFGETDDVDKTSCIQWIFEPSRAVPHVVVGDTPDAGGQWVSNPVRASWDIGALSYAGMLSLPGYTFEDHYHRSNGKPLPSYLRPSRRQVTDYFAAYPCEVGIADTMKFNCHLDDIRRTSSGFHIGSHDISCQHLILASGVFTELIQPRALLRPLLNFPSPSKRADLPLLVVGSGFSAADIIISAPSGQNIVHIYKWAPSTTPSPLRACHQQAYPEYAAVYRRMKHAAQAVMPTERHSKSRRKSSVVMDPDRFGSHGYEGLPNTAIVDVNMTDGEAVVILESDGHRFERRVSGLNYVVGRSGTLDYLNEELQHEFLSPKANVKLISGQTLRELANENLEVTKDVFIVGSLTGDSLIRFAYGGCVYAAGKIMQDRQRQLKDGKLTVNGIHTATAPGQSMTVSPHIKAMNGLDGHSPSPTFQKLDNLQLDRRKDESSVS